MDLTFLWERKMSKEIVMLMIIMWQYNKGYDQNTFECFEGFALPRDRTRFSSQRKP